MQVDIQWSKGPFGEGKDSLVVKVSELAVRFTYMAAAYEFLEWLMGQQTAYELILRAHNNQRTGKKGAMAVETAEVDCRVPIGDFLKKAQGNSGYLEG